MKLQIENLELKNEEQEKKLDEYKLRVKNIEKDLNRSKASESSEKKDTDIVNLKNEIHQLKQLLRSYEEQNFKMSEMEKKLRMQKAKHEKELKLMESKYNEVI